jgi:hypothetical protein
MLLSLLLLFLLHFYIFWLNAMPRNNAQETNLWGWCLQLDEVKNIMVDNIEKVLERGEKIELLVDKTDNLRDQVWEAAILPLLSRPLVWVD